MAEKQTQILPLSPQSCKLITNKDINKAVTQHLNNL